MPIEIIKSEYVIRYPIFKKHNMRFWQSKEGIFCQAFIESTKEFYGHIFKCNIEDFTFQIAK